MYDNTQLRREIGRYLRTLPDRGLSDRYKKDVRRVLLKFNDHCRDLGVKTVSKVKRETITSFMDKYLSLSASQQVKAACFVRMFLNEFDNEAIRKLRLKTASPSRTHVDWLTPDETHRILESCMTPRQSVLIGAGLLQGLRRVETLRMTVGDAQDALQTGVLRVRGKGHKERAIPLHRRFRVVLSNYLRLPSIGDSSEPLLGIQRTRSEKDLHEFCERFGKKFAFHTMRRTFGRNLWLLGVRLETISELLGHASTDVTRLYLGLDLTDMKQALSMYEMGGKPSQGS